jgi:hypothetical protein
MSIQLNPADTSLGAAITRILNSGDDREQLAQYLAVALQQYGGGGGAGGSLQDAPSDGGLYARQNGVWVPVQTEQGASLANQTIYLREEFIDYDFYNGVQPTRWLCGGIGWGQATPDIGHWGQLSIPAGTYLIYNPATTDAIALTSQNFSLLKFAIIRWVLMASAATQTTKEEWWAGFMNSTGNQQQGALFSFAINSGWSNSLPNANGVPGYVDNTKGLIGGTYNGISAGHYGYIQSNYMPKPGVWMDLIVVQTPTQVRFYCGDYGTPPPLVAAINNNICQGPTLPGINNGATAANITLYVDFCEILYQVTDAAAARFKGYDLAKL